MAVILLVIVQVWQNVEVMKIKLDYRKASLEEIQLMNKNDRIRYEIERYRRMELVEKYATDNGMRELTPYDFVTIYSE